MSLTQKNNYVQTDIFSAIQGLKSGKDAFIHLLENMPIRKAIEEWLSHLHPLTAKNYSFYMTDLMNRKIIPDTTVGHFNNVPHEINIGFIKGIEEWCEGTRQVRASCYISFTSYLQYISQGWFRKAMPSNLASNKTFFDVRDKCATDALTLHEWNKFISALKKLNYRDSLIARAILQGGKRVSEVLNAKTDQIDFEKNQIYYYQSKTKGTIRKIPISYPIEYVSGLQKYIESTQDQRTTTDFIFITNKGKRVYRTQLNASFLSASKRARIKKVTPHVLRATWVTIAKKEGVPDSEIMKVTGHSSSKMIYLYDKNEIEDNYSKKMILI
ncbi:MAG: site-specific integrase [Kosmotogaceae bacterium]